MFYRSAVKILSFVTLRLSEIVLNRSSDLNWLFLYPVSRLLTSKFVTVFRRVLFLCWTSYDCYKNSYQFFNNLTVFWSHANWKANKSYKKTRNLVKINFTTIYDLTSSSLTMSALQKFGLQVAKYAAAATPFPNCSGSYLRVIILYLIYIFYMNNIKKQFIKKLQIGRVVDRWIYITTCIPQAHEGFDSMFIL